MNETIDLATNEAQEQLMQAVVLDRFGSVDELKLRSVPLPGLEDNDVLIRVEFAGVGSWDALERQGDWDGAFGVPSTFPYVLGGDAAGVVAAIGDRVTRVKVGDRVYAATMPVPRGGFYAEYGVVDEEYVAHRPDRLPADQAGAMAWDALTALSGLDAIGLSAGETFVVFGASGGIGHLAVQLARHRGARVLAIASGEDGVTLASRLGADVVVDGRREDVLTAAAAFAPDGLDAALFTTGGEIAEHSLGAIKATGRIAWPNGVQPALSVMPTPAVTYFDGDRSRAATDRLNSIIEAHGLEVHLHSVFPLEQARDAHLASRQHYIGKLALGVA